jgi:hypothetical protein
MKNGINVVVSAPVIRISNTKSGILKEAKNISSSGVEKYPVNTRYLRKPNKRASSIIPEMMIVEDSMLVWLAKIISRVFVRNLFIVSL